MSNFNATFAQKMMAKNFTRKPNKIKIHIEARNET